MPAAGCRRGSCASLQSTPRAAPEKGVRAACPPDRASLRLGRPKGTCRMTFTSRHRWLLITLVGLLAVVLVAQGVDGGVSDPTSSHLSAGAAAFDSGLLVFREGLES